MNRNVTMVVFFALMIACIVGADVTFLKNHLVERLIVNIAIVSVFAAIYFAFLKPR